MYFVIDFNSPEALYSQLCNQIIHGIATASIKEGDNLPSVRDMADNIGINMHTVNKAYTLLRQEGYVKLDRRRGAVICIDYDKMRAQSQLKEQMRTALAQAISKDLSAKEIHEVIELVYKEFTGHGF